MRLKFWPLYFILNFSQIFVSGWSLYSLTITQKVIMMFISDIYQDDYSQGFSTRVTIIFSILNAICGLGSVLAAIFILPLADRYGRKSVMLISTVCTIMYTVCYTISKPLNSIVPLMVGRVILGVPLCCNANLLTYLNENCTIKARGYMMALQLGWFFVGYLVQNIISLEVILGSTDLWNYTQLVALIFIVPELICFYWIPESIGYLDSRGQHDAAVRVSVSLYGENHNLNFDLQNSSGRKTSCPAEIASTSHQPPEIVEDNQPMTFSNVWKDKTLLKSLIYISCYIVFHTASGTIQIGFYSAEIIRSFNFTTLQSQCFTLIFTVVRILGCAVGGYLAKIWKRRLQLQTSIIWVIISNLVLFALGFFKSQDPKDSNGSVIKIFEVIFINFMSLSGLISFRVRLWCLQHSFFFTYASAYEVQEARNCYVT